MAVEDSTIRHIPAKIIVTVSDFLQTVNLRGCFVLRIPGTDPATKIAGPYFIFLHHT